MTFPDQEAVAKNSCQMAPSDKAVTVALKTALQQARQDGRLTYGAYNCAKLLELAHESVMLCVLAGSENPDVAVVIQHTLMEAFCLEQGIPLVKVGSGKQLAAILCTCVTGNQNDTEASWNNNGVNCALLQARPKGLTKAEKTLCELCGKSVSGIPLAFPVIELNI